MSRPLPSRYARKVSLLRASWPEATLPSFTHWLRISCCRSSTVSPVCRSFMTRSLLLARNPGLDGRVFESAQHVEMFLRELETCATRLGDDGRGADGSPRVHLLLPAVGALAGQPDAALERQPVRIAARRARVAVDALDERASLIVGVDVRAPAVGEPSDPAQRRLRRHRGIAAAHPDPDRNRPRAR